MRASWTQATLAELVQPVNTIAPKSTFRDSPFTYVDLSAVDRNLKHISGAAVLQGTEAPSRARQLLQQGDVLVSTVRPNLNAVALVGAELDGAVGSTGFSVLRPDRALNSRYLFHWVRTRAFVDSLVRQATGASYPAVSDRIVKAASIPLPLLEEQWQIARVLDAADRIRAARSNTLDRLVQLRDAILTQLLRRGHAPTVRFADLLARPLGNGLSPATTGKHPGSVLTLSALSGDSFDVNARKSCFFNRPPAPRQMVECGTFLISRGNGNLRLVGAGAVVRADLPGVAFPDTMIGTKLDEGKIWTEYLEAIWRSHAVRDQIERASTTTNGTFKINQRNLAAIEIPVPRHAAQEKFAVAAARIASQRQCAQQHLAQIDTLFASLQDRAFKGEL